MTFPKMIGTAEIAQMLGVTREHVTDKLTKRPDFPAPAVNLSRKLRRWRAADFEAWVASASSTATKQRR